MGQQNTLYTGPMRDVESEQIHLHPEPCVAPYGGVTSFPPPYNSHTINRTNFNPRYLPENHGHLPYGITQYNGEHNTFMIPTPSAGVFPVPINQGLHDQLPFSNNHQIFMDGFNGAFKRKNVQYFYSAPGSSSSVPGTMMDSTSFGVPEYRGNHRAGGAIGFDPVVAHNSSHLVHGGQTVQAIPAPWLDQHGATGAISWNRGPGVHYLQGCINGGGMEAPNMGFHGYQVATIDRNSTAFVHPPPPPLTPHQGSHNLYHSPPPPPPPLPPMPPVRGQNTDFHSQHASTSHRHSTNTTTANRFQNGVEPGPRFVGPTPPTGLRVYQTHRRESMIESTARHRSFPHLRVLPEDGVAILDISDHREVGRLVDHHRDMRLDIDDMSYEELLALGEHIGSVGSGLSDGFILNNLKTRKFASSRTSHPLPADQELNFCVICQTDFDNQEKIGVLDCCHEYHVDCIKKWLIVKNTCPICKSTALATQEVMKDFEKP